MPIGSITPFRLTGTVSLTASITSAAVALAGGGDSVVVTNATNGLAYVRFGVDATVTATVADMPILANTRAMLAINGLVSYAAVMLGSGSGTVLFSRGEGSFL